MESTAMRFNILFRTSHHGAMPGMTDEALAVIFIVIVLLTGWYILKQN